MKTPQNLTKLTEQTLRTDRSLQDSTTVAEYDSPPILITLRLADDEYHLSDLSLFSFNYNVTSFVGSVTQVQIEFDHPE